MTDQDGRDREIAELKARLAALEGAAKPPAAPARLPASTAPPRPKANGCLIALAVFVGGILVIGFITSISKPGGSPQPVAAPTAPPPSSSSAPHDASSPPHPAPEYWSYNETSDAMSDGKTKTACTTSTNMVALDFPYRPVTADLCVRKGPKFGQDIYVVLNGNGQILCSVYNCRVRVRFDKGQARAWPAADAADGSSNIVFIRREGAMIAGLKGSKAAVIELQFYQAGVQDLTFNTEGLKWP